MSDYRSCDWCGRSYNYLAIGGPQRNPYCSPKCYKESGAEEELQERMEGARIAREAEEARWNSLSKEEQEAELKAKREEQEAKRRKEEEEQQALKEQADAMLDPKNLIFVLFVAGGFAIVVWILDSMGIITLK